MKIIRCIFGFFLLFSIVFTGVYGRHNIGKIDSIYKAKEYKGIINIYHNENFFGGVNSRRQFLLNVARSFEKKHPGVLIMVTSLSDTALEESLQSGNVPDIISFSLGVNLNNLSPLNLDKNFKGGSVGDRSYALPWCRGGYVIICKQENLQCQNIDKIIVSQNQFNFPLIALAEENIKAKEIIIKNPNDAFSEFVLSDCNYFLGTQRDVVRLCNLSLDYKVIALKNYNDLYQYVAITSTDKNKEYYAKKFVEYLLSSSVQSKLNSLKLCSEFYSTDFEDENLNKIQKTSAKNTLSIFLSKQNFALLKDLSISYAQGDDISKNKIKNLLI